MIDKLLQALLDESNQTQFNINEQPELTDLLNRIITGYREFCRQILTRIHGKTTHFDYQYCEFISLLVRF